MGLANQVSIAGTGPSGSVRTAPGMFALLVTPYVNQYGALSVNTSGGLKSCGHPVAASGVRMVSNVVDRLLGHAGRSRYLAPGPVWRTPSAGPAPCRVWPFLASPEVRAGARALLLGAALALGAPALGAACEARGDRDPSSLRLGVVFAGGGAKAAYEAGLGLALHERRIVPAAIAGTSAGAINAVLLATGEAERLAELWRTIRREDVFAYRAPVVFGGLLPGWLGLRLLVGARGLLDSAPLRATLARHVDLERIRSAPVAVLVVATDLVAGTAHPFDNATLTLDALVASVTVPGLFPPVAMGERLLVDGGVVQRAPILELLATHPLDRLLVVAAYASEPFREATLQPVVERAVELALTREIARDIELARHRHPGVDVQVLAPSTPLRVRPLDFDGARLAPVVELGRGDGRRCLDALSYPREGS